MREHYQKGSFTVEAAILIPLVLFLLMSVVEYGIELYQLSKMRETMEKLENWDAVGCFYEIEMLRGIEEEIKSD